MDERKASLKKNIFYNTGYQILMMLIPLISAPYIARVFEPDGVGIVGYTSSIAAYFVLLAALGTAGYGQRQIARSRDDRQEMSRLFWEIELFCILTTVLSLVIWFLCLAYFEEQYHVFYVLLALKIVAVPFDISWFYAGLEKFRFIIIRNSIVRIIGLILLFTCITQKDHIARYILLTSLTELAGFVSMWGYLPRIIVRTPLNKLDLRRHIKDNLVFFVPTIATSIYNLADKTMLGAITGEIQENGYYEEANKIIGLAKAVIYAFTGAVSPRMSYLFGKGEEKEFGDLMNKSLRTVLMLAFPMCFGIIAVAPRFVPLYFGDRFMDVVGLLRIASFLIIAIGISNCLERQFYTPAGKKRLSNRFVFAGAALNLVLNALLIPRWKAAGAEIATLVTECVITGLYLYFAFKQIDLRKGLGTGWRYLAAGGLMFAAVSFLTHQLPHNWFALIIGVLAGIVLYGGLLLIMKDEMLISLLKRNKNK